MRKSDGKKSSSQRQETKHHLVQGEKLTDVAGSKTEGGRVGPQRKLGDNWEKKIELTAEEKSDFDVRRDTERKIQRMRKVGLQDQMDVSYLQQVMLKN